MVKEIQYKVDINSLEHIHGATDLQMNDIACITISTANPMVYDYYDENRTTGSLIIIDPDSFETIGAGMICKE